MKVIAFDLDGVICDRLQKDGSGIEKYHTCFPNNEVISVVNDLYDQGFFIKIYTARGMSTFSGDVSKVYSSLYNLTELQLTTWSVKYHELVMGKSHYDVLVDDRAIGYSGKISKERIKMFLEIERT